MKFGFFKGSTKTYFPSPGLKFGNFQRLGKLGKGFQEVFWITFSFKEVLIGNFFPGFFPLFPNHVLFFHQVPETPFKIFLSILSSRKLINFS